MSCYCLPKLFKDNQFTVFFLPHIYNQRGQKLQRRNNQGGIKINKQEKKINLALQKSLSNAEHVLRVGIKNPYSEMGICFYELGETHGFAKKIQRQGGSSCMYAF